MSSRDDIDEEVLDQAIAWHQSLVRADADWDGYMEWLEADPRHRQAIDQIALIERAVDDRAPLLREAASSRAGDEHRNGSDMRWWMSGAVVAALAIVAGIAVQLGQPGRRGPADVVFATPAGSHRHLLLRNGVAVDLAPASRLALLAGDPTRLRMLRGEAYFEVDHDPSREMSVLAGRYEVSDIGTRFGVDVAPGYVLVAVAEGTVAVGAAGVSPVSVAAGRQLTAESSTAAARMTTIPATDVGSWRRGRLVYAETPVGVVAADLARYTGRPVSVDPALGDRKFSGVLTIGDGTRLFRDFADVVGASLETDGAGVRLLARRDR